jgi:proteasome assembly chaperone (PAC2) family protein
VRLADGATREIVWPSIDVIAGKLGRDVVLISGPEPSLRWREVLGEITDLATELGVTRAFTLGGIPSVASHRRPRARARDRHQLRARHRDRRVAQRLPGPGGAASVLQVMLGGAGSHDRAVGTGAALRGRGPSPIAIRAVLARVRELGGVQVDLTALDEQTQA